MVSENDSDGVVQATITLKDMAGNEITASSDVTTVIIDNTPPELVTSEMTTSNTNSSLAKIGDTITLTLSFNEEIVEPYITFTSGDEIVEDTPNITNPNGNTWVATYTVSASDTPGTIMYEIDFNDTMGNFAPIKNGGGNISVVIDSSAPLMSITSANPSGATTNDQTINVTFRASESTSDFTSDDITVENGTLSNFSGS